MRITKDYGLISSKLEHDLLVGLNRDIIVAHMKAIEKSSDNERVNRRGKNKTVHKRKYTHLWKRGLNE